MRKTIEKLTLLLSVMLPITSVNSYASGIPTVDIVGNIRGALQLVEDSLTTIENQVQTVQQVQQIQHEIQMIEHQIRNLANLDDFNFADVRSQVETLKNLANRAGSLAYATIKLAEKYEEYKDTGYYRENAEAVNKAVFEEARARWQDHQLNTAKASAAVLEEQAKSVDSDAARLEDLNSQTEGIDGAVQAQQAGNQLQSLTAAQLIQLRTLLMNAQQMAIQQSAAEAEEKALEEAYFRKKLRVEPSREEAMSF